jgi:hypothetical protein
LNLKDEGPLEIKKIHWWFDLYHLWPPLNAQFSLDHTFEALKGTVQRKLRGVKYYINKKVFFSHWTADILFLNLKGTGSLNRKTCFSGLKTINVAFPVQWGFRYKDW